MADTSVQSGTQTKEKAEERIRQFQNFTYEGNEYAPLPEVHQLVAVAKTLVPHVKKSKKVFGFSFDAHYEVTPADLQKINATFTEFPNAKLALHGLLGHKMQALEGGWIQFDNKFTEADAKKFAEFLTRARDNKNSPINFDTVDLIRLDGKGILDAVKQKAPDITPMTDAEKKAAEAAEMQERMQMCIEKYQKDYDYGLQDAKTSCMADKDSDMLPPMDGSAKSPRGLQR